MTECVFCDILDGRARGAYRDKGPVVLLEPLNPVTPGHLLAIPKKHVTDAADDPEVTATTIRIASEYARTYIASFNLITSCGEPATQTVRHLHVHIVPRRYGDGLVLPWAAGHSASVDATPDAGEDGSAVTLSAADVGSRPTSPGTREGEASSASTDDAGTERFKKLKGRVDFEYDPDDGPSGTLQPVGDDTGYDEVVGASPVDDKPVKVVPYEDAGTEHDGDQCVCGCVRWWHVRNGNLGYCFRCGCDKFVLLRRHKAEAWDDASHAHEWVEGDHDQMPYCRIRNAEPKNPNYRIPTEDCACGGGMLGHAGFEHTLDYCGPPRPAADDAGPAHRSLTGHRRTVNCSRGYHEDCSSDSCPCSCHTEAPPAPDVPDGPAYRLTVKGRTVQAIKHQLRKDDLTHDDGTWVAAAIEDVAETAAHALEPYLTVPSAGTPVKTPVDVESDLVLALTKLGPVYEGIRNWWNDTMRKAYREDDTVLDYPEKRVPLFKDLADAIVRAAQRASDKKSSDA